MKKGYFCVHRSLFDHYLFSGEEFSRRDAWIWLLGQASYEPHKLRYQSKVITVGRGEVPTSYRKLAEKWRWSVGRVSRYLSMLSMEGMIDTHTDTGFVIVTICNYDKYQASLTKGDTPIDTDIDTDTDTLIDTDTDTATDTNIKNIKKEKKEKKEREQSKACSPKKNSALQKSGDQISKFPSLSRLPFEDLPPDWGEWAHAAMGWKSDITADIWGEFRDYWQAKPGKTGMKSDWERTWRNWCRNEKPKGGVNGRLPPATLSQNDRFKLGLFASLERRFPGSESQPLQPEQCPLGQEFD